MINYDTNVKEICEKNGIEYEKIQGKIELNNEKGILILLKDAIKIFNANGDQTTSIAVPSNIDTAICFYDVYYSDNKLNVIIATRINYDIACIIDEEEWKIASMHPSK